jgi:predicted Zn-dependent protease with MMP-like domain
MFSLTSPNNPSWIGVYHGADVAEYIWDEMGGSCSNIWGYEDAVDDYIDGHYPTDTSNWRTNACNEGVEVSFIRSY